MCILALLEINAQKGNYTKQGLCKMFTTEEIEKALKVACQAAHESGKVLLRFWGNLSQVREKSSFSDLVTEADQESEKEIKSILQKAYPQHSILAEESGLELKSDTEYLWAIDPLDGTTNYAHHFPVFCVSIALLQNQKPILGVIYDPLRQELFQAAEGCGAYLNGVPLHVSTVQTLSKSLLATGFAYDRQESSDRNYPEFCHLTQLTHGVRRLGSAAIDLSYVAAGRLDGYWERGLKIWDVAAGVLLVKEAGGEISSYDGSPFDIYSGRVLATNGHIHQELSQELIVASHSSSDSH